MTEYFVEVNGKPVKLQVNFDGTLRTLNEQSSEYSVKQVNRCLYTIYNGTSCIDAVVVESNHETTVLLIKGKYYFVNTKTRLEKLSEEILSKTGSNLQSVEIKAPMPGLVLKLNCKVGKEVKEGEPLLVLEAMKMENVIKSPINGIVERVWTHINDPVEKGDLILSVERRS